MHGFEEVLACRKDDDSGWWVVDGGGVSDLALLSGHWRAYREPSGWSLIAAEREKRRRRPPTDVDLPPGELLPAAQCYLIEAAARTAHLLPGWAWPGAERVPSTWPWAPEWWDPSEDPVRNLVKAGALIAAEIDRLQAADRG
ncbi:MAG TPA: hypothetical protein VFU14_20360 [Acidimicrobiales bacterium]|nr:hypothetical protein [Acidimicrobiales bacterium]